MERNWRSPEIYGWRARDELRSISNTTAREWASLLAYRQLPSFSGAICSFSSSQSSSSLTSSPCRNSNGSTQLTKKAKASTFPSQHHSWVAIFHDYQFSKQLENTLGLMNFKYCQQKTFEIKSGLQSNKVMVGQCKSTSAGGLISGHYSEMNSSSCWGSSRGSSSTSTRFILRVT